MCKCHLQCEETRYDATINKYDEHDSYVQLTIYFENTEISTITELPAYDKTRFMADIGGLVGLLVGMSLLSIVEVVVCVCLFVVDCISSCTRKLY